MTGPTEWRPLCYMAVFDDARRAEIADQLDALGWTVIPFRTGLQLIDALSACILGERPWHRIGMVVVEDALPGCRGASIVRGLRELGLDVPIVVIAPTQARDVAALEDPDARVFVLDPPIARLGVAAVARHQAAASEPLRRVA